MPIFNFYRDSALTSQVTGGSPIAAQQDALDTLPPVDVQLWFGSTASALKTRADSNPGVDPIIVSIVDTASGSGEPSTAVKLSTTQGGLAGATPGASLSIGAVINSGTANAMSFWARIDDAVLAVGAYADLKLQTNLRRVEPV